MTGLISDVKRFAVHDGDGIRTTVFLKGCPLNCLWCHNPESIAFAPQLAYYGDKCLSCGECVAVCPNGAHRIEDGAHRFERTLCLACGRCEEVCLGEALRLFGKPMRVEEVLAIVLEDRAFFEKSGGGVTLSGGECLCQADFCASLLQACKKEGLHTAVDTCGFVKREALDKVLPYTDLFLYDLKAWQDETHRRCTGQSIHPVLENLQYLDQKGADIEIRIPYVPEYNDGEMASLARFLRTLQHVRRVKLLPYHNLAGSKYEALQKKNTLPSRLPTKEELARAEALFS